MLHTFPSMEIPGKGDRARRNLTAQAAYIPLNKHGLKLGTRSCSIEQYADSLPASSPHGKRKIWESGQCAIREETRGLRKDRAGPTRICRSILGFCNDISSWIGARNKGAVLETRSTFLQRVSS